MSASTVSVPMMNNFARSCSCGELLLQQMGSQYGVCKRCIGMNYYPTILEKSRTQDSLRMERHNKGSLCNQQCCEQRTAVQIINNP